MKKFITMIAVLGLICGISVNACHIKKTEKYENSVVAPDQKNVKSIEILPTMSTASSAPNRIWVGTFQIVWNEMIDNILKNPVEFVGGTTQTAELLNAREFSKDDISEDSYYSTYGVVSPDLKTRIEKAIKEKFNETSDILGAFDFRYDPNKIFIYAMLKKDFKFLEAFDKLDDETFGNNPNKVKYFGIKAQSQSNLYKNASVLFYNDSNDFALKLHTQSNDEVILYRTNDDKNFEKYFADVKTKAEKYDGNKFFGHNDRLKVPDLKLYQETNFPEVEGRPIKNSDFLISQTLETVDFRMDNEGVKLKSEAAIMMKCTSAGPGFTPQIRYFYYTDNFVLFLIEKDKEVPYFAIRVNDVELLNKTGKKD